MKVGITVISSQGMSFWSSGINQNAVFLAMALRDIPFVEQVFLVDLAEHGLPLDEGDCAYIGARRIGLAEADQLVDVVIEMGGACSIEWTLLQRARGKKIIYHCVGQPYAGMLNSSVFKPNPDAGHIPSARYDAVWMLAKDMQHASWMGTLYRAPVVQVPYVWDAFFLEKRIAELRGLGLSFGFQTEGEYARTAWAVASFEPNVDPIKSSIVPMLVMESAERMRPNALRLMHVLNTMHLVEHHTLLCMANTLDLVRSQRAVFPGRHDFPGYMATHQIQAVVSHQWQNDQNYLYFDALYGGYTLVHNSEYFADVGYYYPQFDIEAGAQALLTALDDHANNFDDYKKRAERIIQQHHPKHSDTVAQYAQQLRAVASEQPQWCAA